MTQSRIRDKGAALILVLAFIFLLSGLVVAYLGRATSDRQLAVGAYGDAAADFLARSATNVVVDDFVEEIYVGSTAIGTGWASPSPTVYYSPNPAANVVPKRNISNIANLIRVSRAADPLASPAVKSRASAVNSTTQPSLNGRLITKSRWNKHCLLPMANPTTADTDPVPISTFDPAPDWVYVTAAGPTPSPSPNAVIGRYAYAVYDEGGLLDINVAGFPSPSPAGSPAGSAIGRKGSVTFADMRALPYNCTPSSGVVPPSVVSLTAIWQIVGWRNNATVQSVVAGGGFPSWNGVTITGTDSFLTFYLGGPTSASQIGINRDFARPSTTVFDVNRMDQVFVTRGQLLAFEKAQRGTSSAFDANSLGYVGTFSRERNMPTWRGSSGVFLANRFYIGNLNAVIPNPSVTPTPSGTPTPTPSATPTPTSTPPDRLLNFNLRWATPVPAASPSTTGVPGHWQYLEPLPSTNLASGIPAISGSADFFQLIHYGLYGTSDADNDPNRMYTTLAVGAALIDQYDDATTTDWRGISPTPTPTPPAPPTQATTATLIQYNGTPGWAWGHETSDPFPQSPSPTPSPGVSPTPPPVPSPSPNPSTYPMLNQPFRNVGEFGYAYRASPTPGPNPLVSPVPTLDFYTKTTTDAPLLDLFTFNQAYPIRSGQVNLNTQNEQVLAAMLLTTWRSTTGSPVNSPDAATVAANIIKETKNSPALGRQDIPRIIAAPNVGSKIGGSTDQDKEAIARALAEATTTRTWGLFIDVIAQAGRCKAGTANLSDFVVDGEKRYWLHVAIDRFSGEVLDQQLEEVLE